LGLLARSASWGIADGTMDATIGGTIGSARGAGGELDEDLDLRRL